MDSQNVLTPLKNCAMKMPGGVLREFVLRSPDKMDDDEFEEFAKTVLQLADIEIARKGL